MENMIEILRNERFSEIENHENKGYKINKAQYRFLDQISISYSDEMYKFNVQLTYPEVYFYIFKENSNIYLTIKEIYDILNKKSDKNIIVNELKTVLQQQKKIHVSNRNQNYLIRTISKDYSEYNIDLDDGKIRIDYNHFLFLIILIQEKSNYLFSKNENKFNDYFDGIIRLLICLLTLEEDNSILTNLGWYYNHKSKSFYLKKLDGEKKVLKYYLTDKQLVSII